MAVNRAKTTEKGTLLTSAIGLPAVSPVTGWRSYSEVAAPQAIPPGRCQSTTPAISIIGSASFPAGSALGCAAAEASSAPDSGSVAVIDMGHVSDGSSGTGATPAGTTSTGRLAGVGMSNGGDDGRLGRLISARRGERGSYVSSIRLTPSPQRSFRPVKPSAGQRSVPEEGSRMKTVSAVSSRSIDPRVQIR